MGKHKHRDKKEKKKFLDDNDEEISDHGRLKAYAEKTGKNIWELCLEDLEEKEKVEEQELSHDEEEIEEDLQDANNNSEDSSEKIKTIEEEVLDKSNKDDYNGSLVIQEKLNVNNNITSEFDNFNLKLSQLKLENTPNKENEYPLILKVNHEITKIIQIDGKHDGNNHNEMNGNTLVKFGNKIVIFEYPKEDTNSLLAEKNKKKKNIEPEIKIEKQDNKKKKKDLEEDIDQETLQRLEEARRKREEFAYLEKCRIEEEEKRKEEDAQKKLIEDSKKQKDKNKYKPKGKKKKGK